MSQEQRVNDEISLKEIAHKISGFWKELLRKWLIVVVCALGFGALGFVYALINPPNYTATLSFIIDDSQANGVLAKYSSLMNQFGLNMGLGGESAISEDNISELIKSRHIVQNALMKHAWINGEQMTLADGLLQSFNWKQKWAEDKNADPGLQELVFANFIDQPNSRLADSVMTLMYERIRHKILTVEKPNAQANILLITCVSKSPDFAKNFAESLIEAVSEYYIGNKTQKTRKTLKYIEDRADSVRNALASAEAQLAKWEDSNKLIQKAEGFLAEIRLRREVSILNVMYAEIVKNLEMTKMVLLDQTPVIQVIDVPVPPLDSSELSEWAGVLLGLIFGGLLASCWIIIRKIYLDAIHGSEPKAS